MRTRWTWVALALVVLLVSSGAACFWAAWTLAHDAAIAVAADREVPTYGPVAGNSWSSELGHPAPQDVEARVASGWIEPSPRLTVVVELRNSRRPSTRPLVLGIDLEFGVSGWRVVGVGDGDAG